MTPPGWRRGWPRGIPVAASHRRAAPSSREPGKHGLTVGAECHAKDPALTREGRDEQCPARDVPEPRGVVLAAGQEGLTVGAERHGTDGSGMREGPVEGRHGRHVPQLGLADIVRGEE